MEIRIQIKCLEILIQEWQMSASYMLYQGNQDFHQEQTVKELR